jgi:hypothetical protein
LYGEYSVRPYLLGQQKDGPSSACVFALLDDYCTHVGIETLDLIYRAYPFQEIRETWDRRILSAYGKTHSGRELIFQLNGVWTA